MNDELKLSQPVQNLLHRGVLIPCPYSVEVDEAVVPERIAPGVIIHTGCRIAGAQDIDRARFGAWQGSSGRD